MLLNCNLYRLYLLVWNWEWIGEAVLEGEIWYWIFGSHHILWKALKSRGTRKENRLGPRKNKTISKDEGLRRPFLSLVKEASCWNRKVGVGTWKLDMMFVDKLVHELLEYFDLFEGRQITLGQSTQDQSKPTEK